jgi:hypothetical protein
MTLMELYRSLPNGFHDGQIGKISIDYMKMEAEIDIRVWVGDLHSKVDQVREECCVGIVRLSGLQFLVIEPPNTRYHFADLGRVHSDMYEWDPKYKADLPAPKDPNAFVTMIYVGSWDSQIYVSALNAEISWVDPEATDA